MWLRLRQPAVIAEVLLASILLSQDTATSSGAPAKAPTTQVRRHAGANAAKTARAAQPQPFTFADVQKLAQERAAHDYQPMSDALPAALANLSYDQFRDIRFRPESALWHGESLFEVQFFHRGYRNRQRVNIFEVGAAGASPATGRTSPGGSGDIRQDGPLQGREAPRQASCHCKRRRSSSGSTRCRSARRALRRRSCRH